MIRSSRIFNANTLFKLSLAIIVMTAVIYMIGFCLGSAAGRNDRENTVSDTVTEDYDESAGSFLTTMCCIIGFAVSLAISGTAINLYFKVDGCKYARAIKHGEEKFCKSLICSVLLSSVTAVATPLILGIFSLATDTVELRDLLVMVLFSLGSSLIFGILIRPFFSFENAGARTALLAVSVAVAMLVLTTVTIATSHIGYTASLISGIVITAVGAVGTVISLISSCSYIKKNWLF